MSDDRNDSPDYRNLLSYLAGRNWQAEEIEPGSALRVLQAAELCPLKYYFQIKHELDEFLFYIVPEITLLEQMRPPVAEYVCRANAGLRIGNFELDFRDGQVCFKSSVNFKGIGLSERLIDNVIRPALVAFDEFFPGMAEVIAGVETPARAIAKAEYG
ncbi:YbjN domain-containing protein [Bradyrhizobium sp. HKCCYLS20291]|uniref:YbjN domain-containing protein n=1 Tax=Bradyrhizobium sp. HKCCYLS20291 TaxID=3420766 RepID=UPI003EBEC6E5